MLSGSIYGKNLARSRLNLNFKQSTSHSPPITLSLIISFSCNESNTTYKPLSSGRIHSVSVVINSNDWNSKIGDAIRKSYADEYLGLPQIEERFSLSHIDYETFSGFARTSRNTFRKILAFPG